MLKTYDEAVALALAAAPTLGSEAAPLLGAIGQVLSEPVLATADDPSFDRSAMDGFAVRHADATEGATLTVRGESAAGSAPNEVECGAGEAIPIMTGGPVPPGADAVVIIEDTERAPDGISIRVLEAPKPGNAIRYQGESIRKGSEVLPAGAVLTPERAGVLAIFGYESAPVVRRARVAVFATGDELVPLGQPLMPGQIHDSNCLTVTAVLRETGAEVTPGDTIADSDPNKADTLARAIDAHDMVVLSGGVSMGAYDWVARTLEEVGCTQIFHKAAVKPGKPVLLCQRGKTLVFGLPGNPVSALVTARIYVQATLRKMMGHPHPRALWMDAVLDEPARKTGSRLTFEPGVTRVADGQLYVRPVRTVGSADASHHAVGDALIVRQPHSPVAEAGSRVRVRLMAFGSPVQ